MGQLLTFHALTHEAVENGDRNESPRWHRVQANNARSRLKSTAAMAAASKMPDQGAAMLCTFPPKGRATNRKFIGGPLQKMFLRSAADYRTRRAAAVSRAVCDGPGRIRRLPNCHDRPRSGAWRADRGKR